MMGSLKLLYGGGFGGTDVHTPIDLPAVGVYDFAAEPATEFNGQFCFAYGGGSDYGDRWSGSDGHIRS